MPSFRRLRAATVAASLAGLAILAIPTAAHAAPIDAITDVTVRAPDPTRPDAPLVVGQTFTVDAQWSVPDSAQSGDTFGLTFPSPVTIPYSQTFDLLDGTEKVGECTAVADGIQCTLGEYVDTHDDVSGTLFFVALASQQHTGDLELVSETGGILPLELPGGRIVGGSEPVDLRKSGFINEQGLGWTIVAPPSILAAGAPAVISDDYDDRLTFDPARLQVRTVPADSWSTWQESSTLLPTTDYTVAQGPGSAFSVTVHLVQPDVFYVVQYRMAVPADVQNGDIFANTARLDDRESSTEIQYVGAGGDGSGTTPRTIAVTKIVTGTGTAPAGPFTVLVDCRVASGAAVTGYPVELAVRAGETVTTSGVPVGATCSVEETVTGGATRTTVAPEAPLTITTASPAVLPVTVTNTFDAVEVPDPSSGGGTAEEPVTPAEPVALAATGADAAGAVMPAAVLFGLGVLLIASARRARRVRG